MAATVLALAGCGSENSNQLRVAMSADYPPFEYIEDGKIVGFDVDVSRSVGEKLGKEVSIHDMAFAAVLPALSSGRADMAASTLAVTEERKKNYSFTRTYFNEELHVLHLKSEAPTIGGKFFGKKIACQIGTTMEMWLKKNAPNCKIQTVDSNVQAVEALLSGHVDAVVVDSAQAKSFCSTNGRLASTFLSMSDGGYAIALKKNSPLLKSIDGAIGELEKDGTMAKLKKKWNLL